MSAPCRLCHRRLDTCAVLNSCDTCTDCQRDAIIKSRQGTRPRVVVVDEWSIFVSALAQAAKGGVVHQDDVRPLIRGRIFHKHIGGFYTRAKREGLLVEAGFEPSGDRIGKNAGRLEPRYELRSAA